MKEKIEIRIEGDYAQIQCMNAIAQVMRHFGITVHDGVSLEEMMLPTFQPMVGEPVPLPFPAVNGIVKWFEETYYRK